MKYTYYFSITLGNTKSDLSVSKLTRKVSGFSSAKCVENRKQVGDVDQSIVGPWLIFEKIRGMHDCSHTSATLRTHTHSLMEKKRHEFKHERTSSNITKGRTGMEGMIY